MAALGKVLEHQAGVLDAQQGVALAETYVRALPVVEDAVEAMQVHAQLVRFIEASDPRLAPSVNCSWYAECMPPDNATSEFII